MVVTVLQNQSSRTLRGSICSSSAAMVCFVMLGCSGGAEVAAHRGKSAALLNPAEACEGGDCPNTRHTVSTDAILNGNSESKNKSDAAFSIVQSSEAMNLSADAGEDLAKEATTITIENLSPYAPKRGTILLTIDAAAARKSGKAQFSAPGIKLDWSGEKVSMVLMPYHPSTKRWFAFGNDSKFANEIVLTVALKSETSDREAKINFKPFLIVTSEFVGTASVIRPLNELTTMGYFAQVSGSFFDLLFGIQR